MSKNQKPPACPACGSERVAQILYGLVDNSDGLVKALEAGYVVLGGCCVTDDDPDYHCHDCGHEWRVSTG